VVDDESPRRGLAHLLLDGGEAMNTLAILLVFANVICLGVNLANYRSDKDAGFLLVAAVNLIAILLLAVIVL
jgi:hypothetical protein